MLAFGPEVKNPALCGLARFRCAVAGVSAAGRVFSRARISARATSFRQSRTSASSSRWSAPGRCRSTRSTGARPACSRATSALDDLEKIPPFSVHDLRVGLEEKPFWADYIGIDPETDEPMPLIVQTSGGTTGLPRPMIFTPRDREVMNIMTGRRLFMQGVRPVRPCSGVAVDGTDQWRRAGARGHLEIQRRGAGDDRLRRADADAPPDRADPRLEGEIPGRLPGLSEAHGAGGARRTRSIDPRTLGIKRPHHASRRRRSRRASRSSGAPTPSTPTAATSAARWRRSAATSTACTCSRTPS